MLNHQPLGKSAPSIFSTKVHFLLLLIASTTCFCQDKEEWHVRDVTVASFFDPGISYEKSIGKFQTLYAQAFAGLSFFASYSPEYGIKSDVYFDPGVTLQYRYYYNFKGREARGKYTEMNSLNYVSAVVGTVFSAGGITENDYTDERRLVTMVGAVWGFQRNYRKRFSLGINVGPGLGFGKASVYDHSGTLTSKTVSRFTLISNTSLGFWLNKRDE
ncbi:MAG TPA: hypothetical protein VFV68_00910 [Agriterribacter sp.]|nr:hypothetical protein [Agriterribacter sp.]